MSENTDICARDDCRHFRSQHGYYAEDDQMHTGFRDGRGPCAQVSNDYLPRTSRPETSCSCPEFAEKPGWLVVRFWKSDVEGARRMQSDVVYSIDEMTELAQSEPCDEIVIGPYPQIPDFSDYFKNWRADND